MTNHETGISNENDPITRFISYVEAHVTNTDEANRLFGVYKVIDNGSQIILPSNVRFQIGNYVKKEGDSDTTPDTYQEHAIFIGVGGKEEACYVGSTPMDGLVAYLGDEELDPDAASILSDRLMSIFERLESEGNFVLQPQTTSN